MAGTNASHHLAEEEDNSCSRARSAWSGTSALGGGVNSPRGMLRYALVAAVQGTVGQLQGVGPCLCLAGSLAFVATSLWTGKHARRTWPNVTRDEPNHAAMRPFGPHFRARCLSGDGPLLATLLGPSSSSDTNVRAVIAWCAVAQARWPSVSTKVVGRPRCATHSPNPQAATAIPVLALGPGTLSANFIPLLPLRGVQEYGENVPRLNALAAIACLLLLHVSCLGSLWREHALLGAVLLLFVPGLSALVFASTDVPSKRAGGSAVLLLLSVLSMLLPAPGVLSWARSSGEGGRSCEEGWSIHTLQLIVAAAVSVAAVYFPRRRPCQLRDVVAEAHSEVAQVGGGADGIRQRLMVWDCALLAGVCALSPAAALAIQALLQHGQGVSRLVTCVQRLCAGALLGRGHVWARGNGLVNLGCWSGDGQSEVEGRKGRCYAEASRALTRLVVECLPQRKQGESVLCVGCGGAEELVAVHDILRWSEVAGGELVGVDARPRATTTELPEGARLEAVPAEALSKFGGKNMFAHVLCVDALYHMDKARVWRDVARLLAPGGDVALTDVVIREGAPLWVHAALRAMDIRLDNHWTAATYERELALCGYQCVSWRSLASEVLAPWLPRALLAHLDYVLVHARLLVRPRVAIVGSGMAGCVAAHVLEDTHDVTIFEARERVNLAGNGIVLPNGTAVDIPLRMFGPHYYDQACALMQDLGVSTQPVDFAASFWGPPPVPAGAGAGVGAAADVVLALTSSSLWVSVLERCLMMGQLAWFSYVIHWVPARETETFGEFVERNRLCERADMAAFVRGQLSWMLSCTYESVRAYPAEYILGFCRAIDPLLSVGKRIVRVEPSNARLEQALLAGKRVRAGCPVWFGADTRGGQRNGEHEEQKDVVLVARTATGGDEDGEVLLDADSLDAKCMKAVRGVGDKCLPDVADECFLVAGERFDRVVIATEAFAVPKIVARDWTTFFRDFHYFASSCVVHSDETLMPRNRQSWRTINVRLDPTKHDAAMLTVWMNAYNPTSDYGGNVFQTWYDHVPPAQDKIIVRAHFSRVVHTVDTPGLHARIADVQGREGFYFCGAYAVPGMGLLEQATLSAMTAARCVLRDTFRSRLDALG